LDGEFSLFLTYLSIATFAGFYLWLLYIALEPFLRRRWSHRIISWSRLLRGEFRDPLVGRDLLIGAASAAPMILAMVITPAVLRWLGRPFFLTLNPGSTRIGSEFFLRLSSQMSAALFLSLILFFLLFMLVIMVRKEWIALVLLGILLTAFGTLVAGGRPILIPANFFSALILIFLLYRYGLLALSAALFFVHLFVFYPITSDFRAWYATDFVIGAVLCIALAAYACYTSMAGQSIFGGKLLED
jgi:serine/threonine-protein kinase